MKLVLQPRRYTSECPTVADTGSPIILMIDRHRRLLDCTRTGTRMLNGHGLLACEFGRIAASRRNDQMGLDRAINIAMEAGNADLTLAELRVEIVRLGSGASDARLLLIFRQVANGAQHVEEAAHLFGLTAAECRLLRLLFDGISLGGAAQFLGIARTTARTHLQRIFDKTGSRRQSDLVRLVALGRAWENQREASEPILARCAASG
jgi:DNA-binding CsgD family transcriptional regulator